MPSQQSGLVFKAIVAAILALVVLVAGWTMILNGTVGENGKDIATNTANISNMKDDVREIKLDQREIRTNQTAMRADQRVILDKINEINAKLPSP